MSDTDIAPPDPIFDALWAADMPPARDPAFVIGVLERAHRRTLWIDLLGLIPAVIALGVVAWILSPAMAELARALARIATAPRFAASLAILAVLGGIYMMLHPSTEFGET